MELKFEEVEHIPPTTRVHELSEEQASIKEALANMKVGQKISFEFAPAELEKEELDKSGKTWYGASRRALLRLSAEQPEKQFKIRVRANKVYLERLNNASKKNEGE